MGRSGHVFRGVGLGLLASVAVTALLIKASRAEDVTRLAQAGMMSNQPRVDRPAQGSGTPAGAGAFSNRPAAQSAPAPAMPVASAALPFSLTQNAAGYTAANIRFSIGPSTYVIPAAEIRGSSLSRDELARLLDPASNVPLAERVAGLSATEIAIPELRADTVAGGVSQTALYRDVRLSDVGSGRIAGATASGGSFDGSTPDGPTRGTFARMEMRETDVALMVALLEGVAGGAAAEMRKVYGTFSIDGLATEGPKGARSRIARVAGRDFRAKPTKEGWLATFTAIPAHTDLNKAEPAERAKVVGAFADMFESFEIGSMEASGIEFSDGTGKDAAGRIGQMAYSGGPGGGEFRIEGFEAGGADGRVRLASFSIGGVTLGPMLAAARELAGKTTEFTPAEFRRLVPMIGSIRLGGIDVETKGNTAKKEAPVRASIGQIELLASKPLENIPTDLRLTVRNVSVPLAGAKDDATKQLAALGYDRLDVSMGANLAWNEPGQELVIRELSGEGAGMGSFLMRGVVGNVPKDAFSTDEAIAAIAWMGASAKALDVIVQNNGLFERLLARQSAEKKKSVDDLRREYGMTAAVGIPIMLGNDPAAKALGQAVARFIAKPGRLTVEARAKAPGGLGVADVVGSPSPTAILEQVEIKATAE